MDDHLGVAVGLENRSLLIQLRPDFRCVGDVAVMRQRDLALVAVHHDGLRVEQRRISGCRISRMSDGQRARHFRQRFGGKDIGDQPHRLMQAKHLAVRRHNARRLLPTMLQRVQAQVGKLRRLRMAVDGHHATFFTQLIGWNQHRSPDRRNSRPFGLPYSFFKSKRCFQVQTPFALQVQTPFALQVQNAVRNSFLKVQTPFQNSLQLRTASEP